MLIVGYPLNCLAKPGRMDDSDKPFANTEIFYSSNRGVVGVFWKIFQCYSKVLGKFVGVVVVKIGEIKHCFMAVPNKSQIKIRICL